MKLTINGRAYTVPDEQAGEPLVWVLRDTLGLVGTRYGCGAGACGSCNVLVNGDVVRSCQALTETVVGKDITTLEGLAQGEKLHPVQQAFSENPLQCCWCMTGHIINAVALLERNPKPSEAQIDDAMNENYCRCGGYNNIRNNVARAAQILASETRGGA